MMMMTTMMMIKKKVDAKEIVGRKVSSFVYLFSISNYWYKISNKDGDNKANKHNYSKIIIEFIDNLNINNYRPLIKFLTAFHHRVITNI